MKDLPKVTIIIPCRNEKKFIGKCLDSLIAQDYPKDKLEILVLNGMSTDKTKTVVEGYGRKHPFIKILDNPNKTSPCALNIGIKNSTGELIIHMGAHSTYQPNYVSKSVNYLIEYGADNVGGILLTLPASNTLIAKAIALVLSNRFGTGNAFFRLGSDKPIWVDTVLGGCYIIEMLLKVGLYNEKLTRSQDMEMNMRIKKAGGKILLAPDIIAYYYPTSTLKEFFKHNFTDGIWAFYPLKFKVPLFKLRHLLPFFFILTLLVSGFISIFFKPFFFIFLSILGLYLIASLFFSFSIAIREKNLGLFFILPLAFACRHFGYGLGSIFGFVKILLPIKK